MNRTCRILSAAAVALLVAGFVIAGRPPEIPFQKTMLDDGANEACAIADVNGDGRLDIVSGENWYEAPSWVKHEFRNLPFTNNYIDDFSNLLLDVDQDKWPDVVSCSWFSRRLDWYRNPGKAGGEWRMQPIETASPIEFCFLVDLDNDGQAREVLPQFGRDDQPLAWYEYSGGAWKKNVVNKKSWGHGIGAGDVNKDGRTDILTPKGWFEAPADARTGNWTFHGDFDLGSLGFMHVLDLNGDGRNDILTSMAHDYGIFWLERAADGTWKKQMIDESWSQAHAVTVADMNGDGKADIVTGKRYMAHNGKDPGEREPLGVYWYESQPREDGKGIEWVRHVIDYSTRAGGGMQIPVADLDNDGDLDFVTAGKSGLHLFRNMSPPMKGKPAKAERIEKPVR